MNRQGNDLTVPIRSADCYQAAERWKFNLLSFIGDFPQKEYFGNSSVLIWIHQKGILSTWWINALVIGSRLVSSMPLLFDTCLFPIVHAVRWMKGNPRKPLGCCFSFVRWAVMRPARGVWSLNDFSPGRCIAYILSSDTVVVEGRAGRGKTGWTVSPPNCYRTVSADTGHNWG